MEKGVIYKLYLGYDDDTIDTFSSLCQMEAHKDGVPIDGGDRLRRLLKGDESEHFLLEERDTKGTKKYKVLTIYDNNQVTIKGGGFAKGLANAVVIAYIYDKDDMENKGKPHIFSYAPVSFE